MLPLLPILAFTLLIAWLVSMLRGRKILGILLGLMLSAMIALTTYQMTLVVQAVSDPVDKERMLLSTSMIRIEDSLAKGDTAIVSKAVHAFNQTLATKTNQSAYYEATAELHDQLESSSRNTNDPSAVKK